MVSKARCEHCGSFTKTTADMRRGVLEDTIHLLEAGLSEDEVMRRVGYTHRESWQRQLRRAGMPPMPAGARFTPPTTLQRLRQAGL